ncbi:unnamed protein product [Protopolystoma xenopodis]|uniref:Uncharacterized protein n=1 Tax=Protopolystoma xenopodis TaxID=117903 RepID=A0A448WTZ0_9PLAT|nr:unnamed protein product [Protopolystoma xenopodis]
MKRSSDDVHHLMDESSARSHPKRGSKSRGLRQHEYCREGKQLQYNAIQPSSSVHCLAIRLPKGDYEHSRGDTILVVISSVTLMIIIEQQTNGAGEREGEAVQTSPGAGGRDGYAPLNPLVATRSWAKLGESRAENCVNKRIGHMKWG